MRESRSEPQELGTSDRYRACILTDVKVELTLQAARGGKNRGLGRVSSVANVGSDLEEILPLLSSRPQFPSSFPVSL